MKNNFQITLSPQSYTFEDGRFTSGEYEDTKIAHLKLISVGSVMKDLIRCKKPFARATRKRMAVRKQIGWTYVISNLDSNYSPKELRDPPTKSENRKAAGHIV